MSYVLALVLTVAVEAPLYGVALARIGAAAARESAGAGVIVNLVSHPVAWLVAWPVLRTVLDPMPSFVVVEALVAAGEWWGLRRWRPFDPALLAAVVLLVNAASIIAGALLLL